MGVIRFPEPGRREEPSSSPPPIKTVRRDGRPARMRNRILPLEVEKLCFAHHGILLIDHLSFTLRPGRRTVILGPNGAGKSLTMKLCHGLLEPTGGVLRWLGPDGGNRSRLARAQAMVFQRPVHLRRSVAENIAFALARQGRRGKDRAARVHCALERSRLLAFADKPARALSCGEQQRLALARAWALRPQLLFLDEPTSALDPAATYDVEELIGALHRASTTIFMSSHDIAQARRLADDIMFIHHGRLLEFGPADAFFAQPATREARAYLAGDLLV